MNPVAKAVWFIESQLTSEITLAEISRVAGVSRFQMARTFGFATGHSVMRYVRGRRLSEAARSLAAGAPDILMVALDAGYGSHEAFTRAFREQFGLTPDMVRSGGTVETLLLVEAFNMDETPRTELLPPRIEDRRPLLIAGFAEPFSFENLSSLPALWRRFRGHIGNIPGQAGGFAYGVCYKPDDTGRFDYIAGVEVTDFASLPVGFDRLRLSEQRYAVFTHQGHVSTLRATFMAIFNDWLPNSGHQSADAPPFERYDERFDANSGLGGLEVWIPIKA